MSNTILKGWAMNNTPGWHTDPESEFYDPEKVFYSVCSKEGGNHHIPAILVLGKEGAEPRVFSEEEVKAMLNELVQASEFGTNARWNVKLMHVHNLAAKHGISL